MDESGGIETPRGSASDADTATTSGLRAALAQKEAALMRLEGKNFLLAAQVQQLERRCGSTKGGGNSSGSSRHTTDSSTHVGPSTEELRLENAKLRGALKKSSDAVAQLARAADALEREKSQRRSAEAEARARTEALRAEEARSASLRDERKAARDQVDNLQRKVTDLERKLADHDASFVAALEDHEAEKSELIAQLKDLEAKAESERRKLQDKVAQLEAGSSGAKAATAVELLGCPQGTDPDSLVWRQRELLIRLVRRSADLEEQLHQARDDVTRRDVIIHNYRVESHQLQVQLQQQQTLQQQLQHQHLQQLQQQQEREQEEHLVQMVAVQHERQERLERMQQEQEQQLLLGQQRQKESANDSQPPRSQSSNAHQDSGQSQVVQDELKERLTQLYNSQSPPSRRIGEERRNEMGIERRPDSGADAAWVNTLEGLHGQDSANGHPLFVTGKGAEEGNLDGDTTEVLVWPGSRGPTNGAEDVGDEDDNALSLGHSHSVPDLHHWSDDEINNGGQTENYEGATMTAGSPASSALGRLPLRTVTMPHGVTNSAPQKATGTSPRAHTSSKETDSTASEVSSAGEASAMSRPSAPGQALGSVNGVPTPQALTTPRR